MKPSKAAAKYAELLADRYADRYIYRSSGYPEGWWEALARAYDTGRRAERRRKRK